MSSPATGPLTNFLLTDKSPWLITLLLGAFGWLTTYTVGRFDKVVVIERELEARKEDARNYVLTATNLSVSKTAACLELTLRDAALASPAAVAASGAPSIPAEAAASPSAPSSGAPASASAGESSGAAAPSSSKNAVRYRATEYIGDNSVDVTRYESRTTLVLTLKKIQPLSGARISFTASFDGPISVKGKSCDTGATPMTVLERAPTTWLIANSLSVMWGLWVAWALALLGLFYRILRRAGDAHAAQTAPAGSAPQNHSELEGG